MSWQKNSAATDIFLDESVSCTRQPSLLPFVSTESCGVYKGSLVSISRLVSSANDDFPLFLSSSLSPWKTPRIYATSSWFGKNPLSSLEYHLLGLLLETARIEPRGGAGLAYLNASEHELAFLRPTKLISSSQAKGDEEYWNVGGRFIASTADSVSI